MVISAPAILSLGIRLVPNSFQPSLDGTQKVYGEVKVSSDISSSSNNLSGIGLSIKNPNLINKKDINLSVFSNGNLLRSVTLNGRSIGDGNFIKFIFDPIDDSKGKVYNMVFSAPGVADGEALEIFLTSNPDGSGIKVGKDVHTEGLSDVVFYHPSNPLSLATIIYEELIGRLAKDMMFFAFYIIILGGLGAYLFTLSKKS